MTGLTGLCCSLAEWCWLVVLNSPQAVVFNQTMRLAFLQGEDLIVNEDEPAVPAHVQHAKPPPAETPGAPGAHGLTSPAAATDSAASFVQCSTASATAAGYHLAIAMCHRQLEQPARLHVCMGHSCTPQLLHHLQGQSRAVCLPALPPCLLVVDRPCHPAGPCRADCL